VSEHIEISHTPQNLHAPQIFAKRPEETPRRESYYKARLSVATSQSILFLKQIASVKPVATAIALSCPELVLVGLSIDRSLTQQVIPFKSRSGVNYSPKTSLPLFQALEHALKDLGRYVAVTPTAEGTCSRSSILQTLTLTQ